MGKSDDSRAGERIRMMKKVQVFSKGLATSSALVLNIGLGGLFLRASPALSVGSQCKLAIPPEGDAGGEGFLVEGTVIRSDAHGMAVRFARELEGPTLEALARQADMIPGGSLARAYLDYFKISQNRNFEGSEALLGVSPQVFRTVFLASFSVCIPLSIGLAWLVKNDISFLPNWLKILLSFGYAAIWFAIIQPFGDLMVFRILKRRASP
ncbi:MAG: hypothetical protein IPO28_12435 [Holophagaceae bacterium]|nr:hypothetical protein [Holophagaceae bacterium]